MSNRDCNLHWAVRITSLILQVNSSGGTTVNIPMIVDDRLFYFIWYTMTHHTSLHKSKTLCALFEIELKIGNKRFHLCSLIVWSVCDNS